ncbi:MAG: hypothetical protein OER22_05690 [Gammaproteobacteria bacterium]|nr:hypothetical protein [Gammaproteobacteria bacterium]MDH3372334.1 hypothetical protein [Gammaproteobacteria bacterium]MDH3410336.1 hypothetical protein [Gammaproteobacteria bacterium]MDH3552091.1 hypothetical protein [Gammaproteobacteria bacterium]
MNNLSDTQGAQQRTWALIRDIAVLQVKLVVDGLRDLILVPASLVAGIVSLVKTRDGKPGSEFYALISVGKQSERWINLFGAIRNAPPDIIEENRFGEADIDDIVSRVESFVVDEYKRGGVTAQAKHRIDKALEAMQRRRKKGSREPL